MMAAEAARIRSWRGPFAAVLLVVVIGLIASDLTPRIVTEFRLRKVMGMLAENPARALQALGRSAPGGALSERQLEIGREVARDAMPRLLGGLRLLRRVGPYPFDPASSAQQYVTPSDEMMLTFDLPANLKPLRPRIRVTNDGHDLCEVRLSEDGTTGMGEVPLSRGNAVVADVDLVCPIGAFGMVTTPIAKGLRLVQKSEGPSLELHAGEQVTPLREGEVARLQVPRGTPIWIEVADELGLRDLHWSVDGMAHDPFDWSGDSALRSRRAELPAHLTSQSSNRRSLELKASNAIGLPTRAFVDLLVRDPGVNPIAYARIDRTEVKDGATIYSGEKVLTLVVTMAKGEVAEDLGVIWDGHPEQPHVSGQEVTILLEADLEGARSLLLEVRHAPLLRAEVVFDWTPPTVTAVLDPGPFARDLKVYKALHEVPVGSIVSVTLADVMLLDRSLVEWKYGGPGLEELIDPDATDPPPARSWTRRFRCANPGEGYVRVFGSDLAGNRSTTHEYRIRVADPMEDRVVTLNGRPFGGAGVIHSSETRLVVRTDGGIEVDGLAFSVLDPEQQNAELARVLLERGEPPKTRVGTADLTFIATSPRRLIGVLSRNERQLVKGDILIDFEPPAFRVVGLDDAGEEDGLPRFFAQPGARVSLTLTDDVGVDVSTVSVRGATMEELFSNASEIGVVLTLPAVLEEPVVVKAADEAGNCTDFRFEVTTRPPADSRPRGETRSPPAPAPPKPRPSPDGSPPAPDPAPLADLQGKPRIVHPQLGTYLLVAPTGDPSVPPFYIGEHELSVKEWRSFVVQLQARGAVVGSREHNRAGSIHSLVTDAVGLLDWNLNVQQTKGGEEPLAGASPDLVRAYVTWANEIARDYGVWKVPTALQWKLAAGRALHPNAEYPTTANFPSGNDLNNEGSGGALFNRDFLAIREMPRRPLQPGAFGVRAMAGSLYEWIIDPQNRLRLIGGSMRSPKEACRLNAPAKSGQEVDKFERGFRLVLLPRAR